jgi:hypothetical protein
MSMGGSWAVGVFLPEPVFACGQLCAVLRSTRSESNLKMLICNNEAQGNVFKHSKVSPKSVDYKKMFNIFQL